MNNRILDLSKEGSFSAGDDAAFASLGYDTTLSVDFCHGINLEFTGKALAEAGISAHVAHFVKAVLEVEAGVEAGLRIAVRLSPEVLEEIGLTAAVQAYLKAYIRARLELSLTLDAIMRQVKTKTSDLQYRIFENFVSQIEIAAGVEANAQLALTAAAEVACKIRLFEAAGKKPGFDFRVNAEAAFLYGAGFDFFAKARFQNIHGFFRSTKDLLLDELKTKTDQQQLLPAKVSRFVFSTLSLAMDMAIDAGMADPEKKRRLTLEHTKTYLLQFIVDEALHAYQSLIEKLVGRLSDRVNTLEEGIIGQIPQVLPILLKIAGTLRRSRQLSDLLPIIEDLIELSGRLQFEYTHQIEEVGTHLYLFGYLIDEDRADNFWKHLPGYAQRRYQEVTSQSVVTIRQREDVYRYLEQSCFTALLDDRVGAIYQLTQVLRHHGLTIAGCLEQLIDDSPGNEPGMISGILFSFLECSFEQLVSDPIRQYLKPAFSKNEFGEAYYKAVFEELPDGFSSLLLPLLKIAYTTSGKEASAQLTFVANRFLLGFVASNVTFMSNELMNYAANNITHSIATCETNIRQGDFRWLAQHLFDKLDDKLSDIIPFGSNFTPSQRIKDELIRATENFLLDILDVAKTSMGRAVWNVPRIALISETIGNLISNPDEDLLNLRLIRPDQLQTKIAELMECSFLPDVSVPHLTRLSDELQAIGLSQFNAYLIKMPGYTSAYFSELLHILVAGPIQEILEALYAQAQRIKAGLEEAIDELIQTIRELEQAVAALIQELLLKAEELFNKTTEAILAYFDALLNDLDFSDLTWLNNVLDWIADLFGGKTDEEKARLVLTELKKQTLQGLNHDHFVTDLVSMAQSEHFDIQQYSNWVNQHVLTPSIRSDLGKIKFKTHSATTEKWLDVNDGLRTQKNDLEHLSFQYVSKTLQLSHRREALDGLSRRKKRFDAQASQVNKPDQPAVGINSPLPIDIQRDDTPMYGKYVYLEIDFNTLDIKHIVNKQFPMTMHELVDAGGQLSAAVLHNRINYLTDIENLPLLQVRLILNGKELQLDQMDIVDQKLSIHLASPWIKQGSNELFLLIITPSSASTATQVRHVQFFCDFSGKKHPTNSVFIDMGQSVFNSAGNDHQGAGKTDVNIKERVVITNRTEREANLTNWRLRDAAGHTYTFSNNRIKPGKSYSLAIGNMPYGGDSWIESYQGRVIAILNNAGEFLSLRDDEDRVISQVYYGYPAQNKHIHFYKNSQSER